MAHLAKASRLSFTTSEFLSFVALIALSITGMIAAHRASMATEMSRNHSSSRVPVNVCRISMFSGDEMGLASLIGAQFQRFNAA